jgi:hypothetical protein
VVSVGESCTLPESFVPLTSVRVDEPAVAVMVTAVALVDCQFKVTLWPVLSEFVLAERVTAGATFDLEFPHDAEPPITATRTPKEIQPSARFIIG